MTLNTDGLMIGSGGDLLLRSGGDLMIRAGDDLMIRSGGDLIHGFRDFARVFTGNRD